MSRPPEIGEPVQYHDSAMPPRAALILRVHDDDRETADLVTFRDDGTEARAEMEYRVPSEQHREATAGPYYRRLER
jgi:hypothetical protein